MLLLAAGAAAPARADVAPQGPDFQVNTYTTTVQGYDVAVHPDGSGGFVVVWDSTGSYGTDSSGRSIQAQRFDAAGSPLGGEFQVNTYTTGDQGVDNKRTVGVASDGAGGFVVVFASEGSAGTDTSSTSVQARRFDATAAPLGAELQVNTFTTNAQGYWGVAVGPDGSGGFVVVWSGYGGTDPDLGIQARRFDAAGAPLGPDFQVNTYTTGYQGYRATPVVGPDGAGGFVVVWESYGSSGTDSSGESIQARRFDATGGPLGPDFQVNTYTTGGQGEAGSLAVGPDGAGGFVVAWDSNGSSGTDSSGRSVQAQRFDAAGAPIGPEFQVNTYTTNDQGCCYGNVAVGPDPDGGFVIAWGSAGSAETDTLLESVQARRFDAAGVPLGAEFQVNTYTTGAQGNDAVAVGSDGSGGFVVAWRSFGSAGTDTSSYSVQARRFVSASASSIGVVPKKLVVVDKLVAAGKAKVAFVVKDPAVTKGAGEDADQIGVEVALAYGSGSAAGSFVVPTGTANGWVVNKSTVAKYVNKSAPAGPTEAKVAVIKPAKLLKLVGKGLGDVPFDILAAGAPAGGVFTAYCVDNAGEENCHCSEFTGCVWKSIGGGTGAKLVCKTGTADSFCTAAAPLTTTSTTSPSTTTSSSTSTSTSTSLTSSTSTSSTSTSTSTSTSVPCNPGSSCASGCSEAQGTDGGCYCVPTNCYLLALTVLDCDTDADCTAPSECVVGTGGTFMNCCNPSACSP